MTVNYNNLYMFKLLSEKPKTSLMSRKQTIASTLFYVLTYIAYVSVCRVGANEKILWEKIFHPSYMQDHVNNKL